MSVTFTQADLDAICQYLGGGGSLRSYFQLEQPDQPRSAFYEWLKVSATPEQREQYGKATGAAGQSAAIPAVPEPPTAAEALLRAKGIAFEVTGGMLTVTGVPGFTIERQVEKLTLEIELARRGML